MKKAIFTIVGILCLLSVRAQQITFTSPSPVYSNDASTTLTAQGENNNLAVDMDVLPALTGSPVITSPANGNYYGFISLSNVHLVSHYNTATGTRSAFTVKMTNSSTTPITVKYTFAVTFIDINAISSGTGQIYTTGNVTYTVTIKPGSVPPPSVGNVLEPGPFTKNDCGAGSHGSTVNYSIPANTYHAATQAAANQMALDAGQAYANANGQCIVAVGNDAMSASNYSKNCAPGTYSAAPVVYTVPANTYFGTTKTDANTLATADLTANAQTYANNYAPCTVVPKPVITNISTSGTTLTITYINTSPPISNGGVQSFAVDNATGQSYPSGTNGPNTTTEVISGLTPGRTYSVTVKIWSDPQHTSTDNISDPFLVTMPGTAPPLITYYNIIESATFIKQGCGNGYQGSSVIFTVPASTYSSLISVDDANSKAIAYINSGAGQTYANSNGTCTQLSGVPTFTAAYGGHDGIVNFIVTPNIPNPYTSTLYWTDTTTGQSGASSGRATGFSSNFTDGHTYQFHFVCNGAGTPSSGTSATQTFNMP